METTVEGEDRVLATAQQIVKSLRTTPDVTDDMLLILSSFDNRLSNISDLISDKHLKTPGNVPLFTRLTAAEKTIFRNLASNIPLFDDPNDSCEFLAAVDDLIDLTAELSEQRPSPAEWIDRAESAVQSAMTKLEEELRRLVVANTIKLDAARLYGCINHDTQTLSFASCGDIALPVDVELGGGIRARNDFVHERGGSLAADVSIDVLRAEIVAEIRDIVDRMVRAKYEKECCQVYSSCRREGLDSCLGILGIERLSIEEVHKIEWNQLDDKMKRWVQVVKIMVRVVLTSEKRLCESIFDGEGCDLIREVCFVESGKWCVLQLLNFGEAVAIGKRSPEKLFRVLDMYEGLSDTLKYLRCLFSDESGEFVIDEAKGVLDALGEAAKGTFVEFEGAVKGEASKKPILGGEIHPLSRYVMNYVKLLVDYGDTLNKLLEDEVAEEAEERSNEEEGKEMSPLGKRLTSLISSLESNIEAKAKFYEDNALQYVFLMNNKLYVVQKVKDSELGKLLGDDWVKSRRGIIRKYATNYLRASWSKVLVCLRDEGIGSGSSSSSKMALKERFKNFNSSFEEIYKAQTSWKVPDSQLRAELRISISERVIPAYRAFLGRFGPHLESGRHAGKYIKYTAEDLDGYLSDLFEGTPGALHHMRRKSS